MSYCNSVITYKLLFNAMLWAFSILPTVKEWVVELFLQEWVLTHNLYINHWIAITQYILVYRHQCFGGACLHLQGNPEWISCMEKILYWGRRGKGTGNVSQWEWHCAVGEDHRWKTQLNEKKWQRFWATIICMKTVTPNNTSFITWFMATCLSTVSNDGSQLEPGILVICYRQGMSHLKIKIIK